ncbi:MAG TPA: hypothetical protein VI792_11695 [Candidatus Eisenbacteria bacterium]
MAGSRGREGAWCAWVAGALLLCAGAAPAAARPQFALSAGRTFAIIGAADNGGPAFELRALWRIREAVSAGLALSASDMGQQVDTLPMGLGKTAGTAQAAFGAAVAAEMRPFLESDRLLLRTLFGGGTAGLVGVRDTHLGTRLYAKGVFGFSGAVGWHLPLGEHATMGPSLHYTRVFDDHLGRFMSAGLDWTW